VGAGDAAARLRPTSDRVREAVFNLLLNAHGVEMEGARVLDLFAGTGALGLEALSRGAARASFVETGRPALAILRANVALLGAEATVMARDARRLGAGEAHDLAFLDPPYGRGLGEAAMRAALDGGWLAPGAVVVWEEGVAPALPRGLEEMDRRRYGDTLITIARAGA
jgi:16S rRNA (guanine966-N2)-methyltransferase